MGPGQIAATIGKFHPTLRSTYTVLARQLVARHVAVCHLTWRTNPTRPGTKKGTLKAPQTLLDGVADIADAACFRWQMSTIMDVLLALVPYLGRPNRAKH